MDSKVSVLTQSPQAEANMELLDAQVLQRLEVVPVVESVGQNFIEKMKYI
jgi:hypothetical protein